MNIICNHLNVVHTLGKTHFQFHRNHPSVHRVPLWMTSGRPNDKFNIKFLYFVKHRTILYCIQENVGKDIYCNINSSIMLTY